MATEKSTKPCENCGKPHTNKRFCSVSCARLICPPPHAIKSLEDRFWQKVDRRGPDECWEWTATRYPTGYGHIGLGKRSLGPGYAHRVSWEIHNGPIPKGMFLCHRCDNPPCVNPSHLFLGTPADNVRDAIAKGRHIKGEQVGGCVLTEADVIAIRRRYAAGGIRQGDLAAEYGVSRSNIGFIVRGRSWAHLNHQR